MPLTFDRPGDTAAELNAFLERLIQKLETGLGDEIKSRLTDGITLNDLAVDESSPLADMVGDRSSALQAVLAWLEEHLGMGGRVAPDRSKITLYPDIESQVRMTPVAMEIAVTD